MVDLDTITSPPTLTPSQVVINGPEDDVSQPVPAPPDPPTTSDPMTSEHNLNMYGDEKIDTAYKTFRGLAMLPTGSEDGGNVLVKVSSKMSVKVVQWTVSRWFVKPQIPSPNTQDPNEVLMSDVVYPANALQTRNGILYRVSGVYTYGLFRAKVAGKSGTVFPMGVSSAETAAPETRFYGSTDFDPKPLDCSQLRDGGGSLLGQTLESVIQSTSD